MLNGTEKINVRFFGKEFYRYSFSIQGENVYLGYRVLCHQVSLLV